MVSIAALGLAIVLAAVTAWIASALLWTVLPWHKREYGRLPDEEAALAALRPQSLAPGQYDFPHLARPGELSNEHVRAKFLEGPVGFLTILPKGVPSMGKAVAFTAAFHLLVSLLVAYVASRALPPGASYMNVFQLTSTVAWLAYGPAVVPEAIWFGRPWSSVAKQLLDALIYALLAAGIFGWLWPEL